MLASPQIPQAVNDVVLEVRDLHARYADGPRPVKAVNGVSFTLRRGRVLALVGESGCGKTTTALAILGLLPHAGRVKQGELLFDGRDLRALSKDEMRRLRGREISMIFEDPVSGLNPILSVGEQVEEIVTAHQSVSKKEARAMVHEALRRVGMSHPERLSKQYPYQLSGGMCQRIGIAIATMLQPQVIVADEPTASLDVTVQAGILQELERLKREQGVSILLITHDLGVVAQMADDVAVMYGGRIAERGPAKQVLKRPRHPYTWSLLAAMPRLDRDRGELQAIKGSPPDLADLPDECAFLPRCRKAVSACRTQPSPPLDEVDSGHVAACYNQVFHQDG